MASDLQFVEHVCDRIGAAGQVSSRKMFGECAIYCDGKVVALVCDNQFFVKPTAAGRTLLGGAAVEAPPYPGAKPHLLVAEQLEDASLMSQLVRRTADALPAPRPKPRKR